eukprot:Opistho-2@5903
MLGARALRGALAATRPWTPVPSVARRTASTSSLPNLVKGNGIVGVRSEDKNRWERRAPISPTDVASLVASGLKVIVQPSNLRIFPDVEYERAGAQISKDLTSASLILGVKEVPVKELLPNRSYMFFSHTHKAQPYNMHMLDAIVEKNIRLVDYELMVDAKGERVVKFGTFAGLAGMIDFLHGMGDRMLWMGYNTPFVNVSFAHMYPSLAVAKESIRAAGKKIKDVGLPKDLSPLVFAFTGNGAVSKGAQEIFRELPHEFVKASDLPDVAVNGSRNTIYGCVVEAQDYVVPIDSKTAFSRADFFGHPEKYRSEFHTKIAPHVSGIVNGIYWESKYPRLLTCDQMAELAAHGRPKLLGVADISADPNGSIQFMSKCTTIDHPFFVYNPKTGRTHSGTHGEGVVVLAVDNLPAELPREASEFFGNLLAPHVKPLALSDGSKPFGQQTDLGPILQGAVIASNGALTPKYAYIAALRTARRKEEKHVLVLGSGLVAGPLVDRLLKTERNRVTIASISAEEARGLARGRDRVSVAPLDVHDEKSLGALVGKHDLVVSFVPASFHMVALRACVAHKKHMVTASYISPEMRAADQSALDAGITVLNEIGLDPGIDHLSAMKIIDEVHAHGGKITSFVSWCGGLPAPEVSDNPLGYKFSWSPRGVLNAGLNGAVYRHDGEMKSVAPGSLFTAAQTVDIYPGFNLEGLPNRDSLSYAAPYKIPDVPTMFRGTLRYKGFSRIMQGFAELGLFDTKESAFLAQSGGNLTWRQVLLSLLPPGTTDVETAALAKMKASKSSDDGQKLLHAIRWFGLASEAKAPKASTYIDTLCGTLQSKLAYGTGERDLVLLHHSIGVEWPKTGKKELLTSTLVSYGDPEGYSAMSRTVGIPAAIAADLILAGTITRRGVLAPITKDIYEPILSELEKENIVCVERTVQA